MKMHITCNHMIVLRNVRYCFFLMFIFLFEMYIIYIFSHWYSLPLDMFTPNKLWNCTTFYWWVIFLGHCYWCSLVIFIWQQTSVHKINYLFTFSPRGQQKKLTPLSPNFFFSCCHSQLGTVPGSIVNCNNCLSCLYVAGDIPIQQHTTRLWRQKWNNYHVTSVLDH